MKFTTITFALIATLVTSDVVSARSVAMQSRSRLDGLSSCARGCLEGASKTAGCHGEDDTACLCGDAFRNAASPCIFGQCPGDIVAVLGLQGQICGNRRRSLLDGLSDCAKNCLNAAKDQAGCSGEEDTACICGDAFRNAASPCIIGQCPGDVGAVLAKQGQVCH